MAIQRIYPIAGKVQGNDLVAFVPSIATPSAPSVATEVNAATALALECFLRDFAPTATQNTGTGPRRLCDKAVFNQLGFTTWDVGSLEYVWRPSEASTTDDNKAYATLTEGLTCYIVQRSDVDHATAIAAGQYVNVFHVTLGARNIARSGDASDEFAEYQISQAVQILEAPQIHVALVA